MESADVRMCLLLTYRYTAVAWTDLKTAVRYFHIVCALRLPHGYAIPLAAYTCGGALPLYESLILSLRPVHVQPNQDHVPGRRLGALMAA